MGVRKYRSVEEMSPTPALRSLRTDNLRIACELTELAYALRPWSFSPGVMKFSSMDEANLHRRAWEKQQVRSRASQRGDGAGGGCFQRGTRS